MCQQQELEQKRMERELEALCEVYQVGLKETALFLAAELGLEQQFNQEIGKWRKFLKWW